MGIILLLTRPSPAAAQTACEGVAVCVGRPAPNVNFRGDQIIENPIEVNVCHGYWDLLASPKWWNVTIRFNTWEEDLDPVRRQCKTYWVRPGTDMRLYASCVSAIIGTGPMRVSGTYVMDLTHTYDH